MRVRLLHDYLLVLRGAERTFAAMCDAYPGAPISTLLYDREATNGRFDGHAVSTSRLQRLPVGQSNFRRLLPVFPLAAERLEVGGADIVVSSSSAFAHGVQVPDGVPHVCYCHSPFRYVWHERARAMDELGPLRPVGGPLLERIRRWDEAASARVTTYVANSRITQERIADFYGRESVVVHPPVEVDRFSPGEPEDYFLMVGEVTHHKNPHVGLEAARRAGARIVVVGDGPARDELAARYAGTATFAGRVDDEELARLYRGARAFVMPAVEEFGIVAVEAMASGRPVLAAGAGGATEFVDATTGVLVPPRDVDATAEAMRHTDWAAFDQQAVRRSAERFAAPEFIRRLRDVVAAQRDGG
jgi:glycosyltransferase involved in cell wall biosynthesis